MFKHEQLPVYRRALAFCVFACQLADKLPDDVADLPDQLREAALLIPAKIARGAGIDDDPPDLEALAIAGSAATKSVVILDVLKAERAISAQTHDTAIAMLTDVAEGLAKLTEG